ncbi:Fibronectin type-III domain-containing protein [Fusarium keratoplasticum]|uniref:Fibronectin type-III domain-containing protein n=1 Tax=Fusarium keratoplasticum TaxID=1328300 RepID=A0ACC0RF43_9HYPO|nr:Fibronectin type-III domain-containing protein [Fusarium keratoplasticum]KAI8684726.1 Fibronectin type-III domain-containing protein [Fusarium keratoplasticum]KAI8688836.1 Fibronectin type-III domain-containing protein [Fusarium keratoplasticum]
MSWELPVLTTLILSVLGFWWVYSPRASYQKALLYALLCSLTLLVDPRRLLEHMSPASIEALLDIRIHVLLIHHFKMVLTLGAVVWLLHRSWQTLWKPVPDLINILGVDVPEPPDVSLAGIRSDAATLSWTRPNSNRPVQKYTIQVNGVHVGDSPGNEVAITVTGLKPDHFYNIRVVAVGPNNFQAGSQVLRLRTFGKDGKPQLGNSRVPTSFANNDHPRPRLGDETDDADSQRKPPVPSVEAAPVLDGNNASTSDVSTTAPGQRRNTVNRRHSPSVASLDQPQIRASTSDGPELSLDELNRRFESTRREVDEIVAQIAKEECELRQQEEELKAEKDAKRQALREKEDQTAQLKSGVRTSMEQMRAAEKERGRKRDQLNEKEKKKSKVRDNIAKLESEVERMKNEREGFDAQKTELEANRDKQGQELDESNAELQEKCAELEAELKDKGKQLQDLKAAREQLPGGNDEQWKENDAQVRKEWESRRKELHSQLVAETKKGHQLDMHIRALTEQLAALQHQSGLAYYNQADPAALEYEPPVSTQDKRHSGNSNSLSNLNLSPPPGQFAIPEDSFPVSTGFTRAGFGPGLFMDMTADNPDDHQSESDFRSAAGPLSPTAHALLPSDIFDELLEDTESRPPPSHFLPEAITAGEDDRPQSPASSDGRSLNVFSSPQGSSHNLPFPQYTESDAQSLNLHASPTAPPATGHRLTSLLSNFQRNRAPKPSDELGPLFGTLKPGQSQSFPRSLEDHEISGAKRRISFSWMKPHAGPESSRTAGSGSKSFSTRRLNPFASSAGALTGDRDSPNSRPASIASTDLPRPSTDSGSIWGVPGDFSLIAKNRMWSANEGRWPSRNPSRRPSIGGSPSNLETSLASAEDEILDVDDLLNPQTSPSQVGVIGSRPPSHRASMSQRLNPAAPTFMGSIFGVREKDSGAEKEKSKGKEKERHRDKSKEGRSKSKEALTPSIEVPPSLDDSPSDSRMSRDTFSVHTQLSVSESHESLNLDSTASNSTDHNAPSHKDPENVVKKLFRKGSSSKFSLSSRLGKDSGLFKKGPGSATFSEKNMSAEHRSSIGDLDEFGEDSTPLGRGTESMTSSPSLGTGSFRSKDAKESRMNAWRFGIKKKGKDAPAKEKESMDIERPADTE